MTHRGPVRSLIDMVGSVRALVRDVGGPILLLVVACGGRRTSTGRDAGLGGTAGEVGAAGTSGGHIPQNPDDGGEGPVVGGSGGTAGGSTASGGAADDSAGEGGSAEAGRGGSSSGAGGGSSGAGLGGTSAGASGREGTGGVAGRATPPSCDGLPSTCGPEQTLDCCEVASVPEGTGPDGTIFGFDLDRFEVTVGRFRKFLAAYEDGFRPPEGAGKHPNDPDDPRWSYSAYLPDDLLLAIRDSQPGPHSWSDRPGEYENLPLNFLEWAPAFAFCIWDGGRLPTLEEWTYVASGGEERYHPWSSPPSDRTIDQNHASYACLADGVDGCAIGDLTPVGAKPQGQGRWAHADLAGNVWEWTRDLGSFAGLPEGYACGGGFRDPASYVRVFCMQSPAPPKVMSGVRCAR